jgi:hypothetical protein
MMVRSPDPAVRARLDDILDALADSVERGQDPLTRMSASEVVDVFWPATDGWSTAAVEPGVDYVTWVLTHPSQGVAACMLITLDTGEEHAGRTAHPDDWDRLDADRRGRNLYFSRHLHGPNPTAAVLQFWPILAEKWLLVGEHELLNRVVTVPAFMDGAARTMHGLGAFDVLLSDGATERGRWTRLREVARAHAR